MTEVVHMIGALASVDVRRVRTWCGRVIYNPLVSGSPMRYELIAPNGNVFKCTTQAQAVSCQKCSSQITGAQSARPQVVS